MLKFLHSLTGSRIASWLPSFSVEVMHTSNILGIAQANNSQLMAMVSSYFLSDGIPLLEIFDTRFIFFSWIFADSV